MPGRGADAYKGMSSGGRSRYLKAIGLVAFFVVVFLWLAPKERAKVEGIVGGRIRLVDCQCKLMRYVCRL